MPDLVHGHRGLEPNLPLSQVAVGQGAWEDDMLADTRALERVLVDKGLPAIVGYRGHDVHYDWPWWRRMLPHYLERLGV